MTSSSLGSLLLFQLLLESSEFGDCDLLFFIHYLIDTFDFFNLIFVSTIEIVLANENSRSASTLTQYRF